MKTDQNARMHNTLSDLSTRRLSCEQTEMILKNYGKKNNRGSDFCMRMQQTSSPSCSTMYHITIASKHKRRKLRLVGASEFLLLAGTMDVALLAIFCRCAGCSKFSLRYATRSFLHVNGSKSAIRCILRSVSKPTLVIFGTFEVGKAYRIDLIL